MRDSRQALIKGNAKKFGGRASRYASGVDSDIVGVPIDGFTGEKNEFRFGRFDRKS